MNSRDPEFRMAALKKMAREHGYTLTALAAASRMSITWYRAAIFGGVIARYTESGIRARSVTVGALGPAAARIMGCDDGGVFPPPKARRRRPAAVALLVLAPLVSAVWFVA